MPEKGARVVGVHEVKVMLVQYFDDAGQQQVTPVAVFAGDVVKFKDDQLVLDRRNTPDFLVEGVKEHVASLEDKGAEEA